MRLLLFLTVIILFSKTVSAQLPEGFYDEVVLADLDQFCGVTFDKSGRGFLWERNGRVFMLDTNGVMLPDPVVDISEEVANWWDMGMLGFALDPDFLENGNIYMLYVVDRHHLLYFGTPHYDSNETIKDQATIGRITRYTADATDNFKSILPGSRKVLLGETMESGFPLLFKTHGTGTLAFGTDGTLLASCGETGHPDWADTGNSGDTYFGQALQDGIIRPAENVGAFRSQLVNSLSGKIIRIDPQTGSGLPSNPFYDPSNPNSPVSKVWSLGLRNPYRMVVRPNSGSHFTGDGNPGEIFIGDVGSNYWEELNIASAGGQNFGWPIYEGFEIQSNYVSKNINNLDAPNPLFGIGGCEEEYFKFTDLVAPPFLQAEDLFRNPCEPSIPIPPSVNTFLHSRPSLAYRNKDDNFLPEVFIPSYNDDGIPIALSIEEPDSGVEGAPFIGISSLGGHFYQGDNFPEEYRGKYFHPDYHGWIRLIEFDDETIPSKIEPFHTEAKNIVSLTENPYNGCLCYIDFKNKSLRKICFGGTPAPVAIAVADRFYGVSPLEVHFDGANSYSLAGSPINYYWEFGDGTYSTEISPTHIFTAPVNGPYTFTVRLVVSDTAGQTKGDELLISLNNTPPLVDITSLPDSSFYALDVTSLVQLEGTATDAEHAQNELSYEWRTFLHHDTHEHTDLIENGQSTRFFISPLGCNDELYWYRVELSVTDAAGLVGKAKAELFPYCEDDLFELDYFIGEKNNRSVQLKWKTFFENNITSFEIEKGKTIFDFKKIGVVESHGDGAYDFIDHTPYAGTNFYRLKILNTENVFSYTTLVFIDFSIAGKETVLYPNPFINNINVSIKNTEADKVELKLYDLIGRLILKKSWPSKINESFFGMIEPFDIPAGVYYYELISGEIKNIGTIVKN